MPVTCRRRTSASPAASHTPADSSLLVASDRAWAMVTAAFGNASAHRLGFLELLRLVVGDERVHDLLHVLVEDLQKAVDGEADPVVRDARLVEVICADLLAPVARSHLALPVARDGLLLLFEGHLVKARAQHLHGLLPVLDLALLVLAGDDGVGRQMGDAHRR